jgi:hypothetical protein
VLAVGLVVGASHSVQGRIVLAAMQSAAGRHPADGNFGLMRGTRRSEVRQSKFLGRQESKLTNMQALSAVGFGLAISIGMSAPLAVADEAAKISVMLKDHRFSPAEPTAPAGKPIVIEVENQDKTPAELESKALRVEKVVPGGGKISVQVRALPAGRYRFFDDYHESTTEGFLVTQ